MSSTGISFVEGKKRRRLEEKQKVGVRPAQRQMVPIAIVETGGRAVSVMLVEEARQ
jgi:hypothetical protein